MCIVNNFDNTLYFFLQLNRLLSHVSQWRMTQIAVEVFAILLIPERIYRINY
jgi:hypothetical protein